LDRKIKRIHVDGGGEYSSTDYLGYLTECGIIKESTASYSAQQNGLSERCNRTIMDPARSMLKAASMPNQFSAEAINTAVYIKNRVSTRATPNTTPFAKWFGQTRSESPANLWMSGIDSHYKLYNTSSKRVFISRDIRCDETKFYGDMSKRSQIDMQLLLNRGTESKTNQTPTNLKLSISHLCRQPHQERMPVDLMIYRLIL
jgi:hypothetical protein